MRLWTHIPEALVVRELWDGNGEIGWSEPVARIMSYRFEGADVWDLHRIRPHCDAQGNMIGTSPELIASGYGAYPHDDAMTARMVGYE